MRRLENRSSSSLLVERPDVGVLDRIDMGQQPLLEACLSPPGEFRRKGVALESPECVEQAGERGQAIPPSPRRPCRGSGHQDPFQLACGRSRANGPGRSIGQNTADRAHGCTLACIVTVEAQDGALDLSPQQLDLVFREGGPKRSDRFCDTCIGESNGIHIAFDNDDAPALARSRCGAVQVVERAALVEERRIRDC